MEGKRRDENGRKGTGAGEAGMQAGLGIKVNESRSMGEKNLMIERERVRKGEKGKQAGR